MAAPLKIRLPAFQSRERRLLLIGAAIAGCWALLSGLMQPLWDHLREHRMAVEAHTNKLDALGRLLTQFQAIEGAYVRLAGYLEQRGNEEARGVFLNDLEQLSRTAGVALNLKPRPLKMQDRIGRFEIEVDAEGSSEHMMAFLDALFRMPSLVIIERLRIAVLPSKGRLLRANLVIQRLLVRQ